MEDYIDILRDLNQRYGHFNSNDKEVIKNLVAELEIEGVTFKTRCSSCYNDAFILILNKLSIKSSELAVIKPVNEKYSYTKTVDSVWYSSNYGKNVLNEYTSVDMIEAYLSENPNSKLYVIND